jgi:tRNA(Ile)-lysidine synthase
LYHFRVQLVERLLKAIRKQGLIKPGDRVAAAVSGGADSVALLLLLVELRAELGIVLSVAHVNHKLREGESDADQRFVEDLCLSHALELHCQAAPLHPNQHTGIEATARDLRYKFFCRLAAENGGMKIVTGHTRDDQAETVLLRILRGTGIRGLAGIHPRIVLRQQGSTVGEVVRPLLGFRRAELRDFLRAREQTWREDSTNQDPQFLRNRVRHAVLPILQESFGDAVVDNLSDLAEIARAEDGHWAVSHPEIRARASALDAAALLSMPIAMQRRLIRAWIETHAPDTAVSFPMIEEVRELTSEAPGKVLEIASGDRIRRTRESLQFETLEAQAGANDYAYSLSIPGKIAIPELGISIQATIAQISDVPETERIYLLDPDRLPQALTVRNWQPGDRFWAAHTKGPRKLKELLNDRHVVGLEKKMWPVLAAGQELVWVRGFAAHNSLSPQPGSKRALWIREVGGKWPHRWTA